MESTSTNKPQRPNATDEGYRIDPAGDYFITDAATRHSKRPALIMLMVGAMTFGSFLWLRMRLVSDMPRQAYADPDSSQQQNPRQSPLPDPQQDTPQQPQQDNSRKVMDLDDEAPRDQDAPRDTSTPYSVNDASGGVN